MLQIYRANEGCLHREEYTPGHPLPQDAVWLDLLEPTADEVAAVEQALGTALPTREEMGDIEPSSRLYEEDGALVMTATVLAGAERGLPGTRPVTFILNGGRLVTVRHSEPRAFQQFATRCQRPRSGHTSAELVLAGLLEAISDRIADLLEKLAMDVDALSLEIFEFETGPQLRRDLQLIVRAVGRQGDLNSKARESLVSLGRLTAFFAMVATGRGMGGDLRSRLKSLAKDTDALADHASFLSNKITFLLDATLGLINIEQNAIIKIFSVAAVVFLPPTLVASIYGMNFRHMPELDWAMGYPVAIGLMVMSAILPYMYFKRRRWL